MSYMDTAPLNSENQLLAALRDFDHWVLWRLVDDRKVPYQPNGSKASSTNPATWSSYADASAALAGGKYGGIGFVLTANDPFTCIDLDATDDAVILQRQTKTFNELFPIAYAELSPSGRGAHLWVRGAVETRKGDKIEVYSDARYMTVTGQAFPGRNLPLPEAQAQLNDLIAALDRTKPKNTSVATGQDFPELRTDDEVLGLVLADAVAHNGLSFTTITTTSTARSAQHSHVDLCPDSPFALRPASQSGRCTVGSMHYPPASSRNTALSTKDPAPP